MDYKKLQQKWNEERNERMRLAASLKLRIIRKGPALFEKHRISKVILFGSIETGACGPKSDIDLYVQPLPKEKYWDFLREIQQLLETNVDLYTESDDKDFVEKIIARGEVIYEV